MGKLTINKINKENLNTGITKDDLINEIKDLKKENELKDNEIELLKSQINSSQSRADLITLTNGIKSNDNLNIQDKTELLKSIVIDYQNKYSKLSDNYQELKNDIQFLLNDIQGYSGLTQIAFILTAERLKTIRDNELYKPEYKDFKEFYTKEIKKPESTVFMYIAIVEYFNDLFEIDNNSNLIRVEYNDMQYSKLIPFLPLLKSKDISDIEKQGIKDNAIELLSEDKNQRDIINIAKELKLKYGLVKEKQDNDIDKLIKGFIKKLPKDLTSKGKEDIINKIKERFNQ